jgi:hypothetical protein
VVAKVIFPCSCEGIAQVLRMNGGGDDDGAASSGGRREIRYNKAKHLGEQCLNGIMPSQGYDPRTP